MSQEESIAFNRVTIVGPGLLGASLGICMREKGMAKQVWAYLRDEEKRKTCNNASWCELALSDLGKSVEKSDLIVICTPVETIKCLLPEIAEWSKPGSIVTDVGSLKNDICRKADDLFSCKNSHFVGSHPMTGSEKSGMKFASPELFDGKNCIVTPSAQADNDIVGKLSEMWQKLGMRVTQMEAIVHDEMVGWISHLPHVAASALMNAMSANKTGSVHLCGNGLRDTTRIAGGNAEMWKQIILGNKKNMIVGIEELINQLERIKMTLTSSNEKELLDLLVMAKNKRDALND